MLRAESKVTTERDIYFLRPISLSNAHSEILSQLKTRDATEIEKKNGN